MKTRLIHAAVLAALLTACGDSAPPAAETPTPAPAPQAESAPQAEPVAAAPAPAPEAAPATPAPATTEPAATPTASAPAAAPADPAAGQQTYRQACAFCHDKGVAGAPKTGDAAAWSARLAQGMDTLYTVALKGKGAMPAKGGNASLSDDAVKAAVDYMVAQSR